MALSLPDWSLAHPFWGDAPPAPGSTLAAGSSSPKLHPPDAWSRLSWAWAGLEHPCIPLQASREGQQQGCLEAVREGREEEGTGVGSRGDRPVGAAWLLSMGGVYHCHRLGLITGTCLQPRQLPASVITSNRAGLGSPAEPHGFPAARSPALPQHHPTGLPAAGPGTRCPVHPATGLGPCRHHQLC